MPLNWCLNLRDKVRQTCGTPALPWNHGSRTICSGELSKRTHSPPRNARRPETSGLTKAPATDQLHLKSTCTYPTSTIQIRPSSQAPQTEKRIRDAWTSLQLCSSQASVRLTNRQNKRTAEYSLPYAASRIWDSISNSCTTRTKNGRLSTSNVQRYQGRR